MPRVSRFVAPGLLHHVTQRGNNRECTFVCDQDRLDYLNRLLRHARGSGVAVFGFCLMSNHVHLVLRPERPDSLAVCLRRAHSEYAQQFNRRHGRSGHLWQNRYYSCPLEHSYVFNALRYVDLNPVRAGLVKDARNYRWSSALAHCDRQADEFGLLELEWMTWRDWPDWLDLLQGANAEEDVRLRKHTKMSWPLGSQDFVRACADQAQRRLGPLPTGRPRQSTSEGSPQLLNIPFSTGKL